MMVIEKLIVDGLCFTIDDDGPADGDREISADRQGLHRPWPDFG